MAHCYTVDQTDTVSPSVNSVVSSKRPKTLTEYRAWRYIQVETRLTVWFRAVTERCWGSCKAPNDSLWLLACAPCGQGLRFPASTSLFRRGMIGTSRKASWKADYRERKKKWKKVDFFLDKLETLCYITSVINKKAEDIYAFLSCPFPSCHFPVVRYRRNRA